MKQFLNWLQLTAVGLEHSKTTKLHMLPVVVGCIGEGQWLPVQEVRSQWCLLCSTALDFFRPHWAAWYIAWLGVCVIHFGHLHQEDRQCAFQSSTLLIEGHTVPYIDVNLLIEGHTDMIQCLLLMLTNGQDLCSKYKLPSILTSCEARPENLAKGQEPSPNSPYFTTA